MSLSDSLHKSKCFVVECIERSRVCSGWVSKTSSLVILNFLLLLSCLAALVSHSSSGASDLQTQSLLGMFSSSSAGFFPPPSLLCLQFTPASGFQALPLNYFALQKAISSSSAAFPLFLTLLFLPMCRVFPGVAAAVLVGRCCTAAPLLAAVVAAAWGVWGSEGASTGGATSKRTRWSCTRKSLPHLPHPPAPHLWSPVPRSTPAPPMSRRPGADKEVF